MSTNTLQASTIVVTGAASGIGQRTGQLLIELGANIIALDRHRPNYAVSQFLEVDLAKRESIDACVEKLRSLKIDALCNIAGVPGTRPDDEVASVNYLGVRRLTEALLPSMVSGGAIVNIASVAGCAWRERIEDHAALAKTQGWDEAQEWISEHPHINEQAYRKYKEALLVWTQMAAPAMMKTYDVRMNCVSPGPVDTPILNDFKTSLGTDNVNHSISLTRRAGTPDDIAPVVIFLLTPASRWIVGSELLVDGGLTASRLIETAKSF